MRSDPLGAAVALRETLERLIRLCSARARDLDRYVWGRGDDSDERLRIMADVEGLMKIADRAEKLLARLLKDDPERGACAGSCEGGACETLVAAMLLGRGGAPPAGGDPSCAFDCMTLAEAAGEA